MFSEIEARRLAANISQKDLCQRAGVHQTAYTRRKSGRGGMGERTLSKLKTALDEMISEQIAALSEERSEQ
ncbi:helix-turn-helix transcriptional regulator [Martelella alba]|uniref:Helix-turn-helix transcriptional regulator n=1 Tax=Martelella alba TaxID=2590451 RepID=A0A506UIT7_9HYPH|nr:helix-turn-helix transcriptional regulator [Martelella alba]TPW33220.1 helix-turn-helix transcriptional regulator [Martelella alba]